MSYYLKEKGEFKAAIQNRVENARQKIILRKFDKEKHIQSNRIKNEIYNLENDLKILNSETTGFMHKTHPSLKVIDSYANTNNQSIYKGFLSEMDMRLENELLRLSSNQKSSKYRNKSSAKIFQMSRVTNLKAHEPNYIDQLKKADKIFAKRHTQISYCKQNPQRAPTAYDPKNHDYYFRNPMPKALIQNRKKELIERAKRLVSPRVNPFKSEQLKLRNGPIKDFLEKIS